MLELRRADVRLYLVSVATASSAWKGMRSMSSNTKKTKLKSAVKSQWVMLFKDD